MSKKRLFLVIVIIIAIVIALSYESLLNKIIEADILDLKVTVTFEKDIDISKLKELEKNCKIHIEGVEVSFKDKNGEIATSMIVFKGYEMLIEEITTISERREFEVIGITGIYAISNHSGIQNIKQDDTVFAVESNVSLPQVSSSFGNYKETKTWELNKQ